MADKHPTVRQIVAERRARVLDAAANAGLLTGGRIPIRARVCTKLLQAAKEKSGLEATTDIVEYALAKVAMEDDFAAKLLSRRDHAPRDLDLEFHVAEFSGV